MLGTPGMGSSMPQGSVQPIRPFNTATSYYICGDCGAENELKARELIRCHECGYRILYKKRTQRTIMFEAR